mgnify:CR=1 FL=1|tara:strand:+ start:28773 stop:30257 length:1485 start_codon:yes stop_codon:yes gene_type:complete
MIFPRDIIAKLKWKLLGKGLFSQWQDSLTYGPPYGPPPISGPNWDNPDDYSSLQARGLVGELTDNSEGIRVLEDQIQDIDDLISTAKDYLENAQEYPVQVFELLEFAWNLCANDPVYESDLNIEGFGNAAFKAYVKTGAAPNEVIQNGEELVSALKSQEFRYFPGATLDNRKAAIENVIEARHEKLMIEFENLIQRSWINGKLFRELDPSKKIYEIWKNFEATWLVKVFEGFLSESQIASIVTPKKKGALEVVEEFIKAIPFRLTEDVQKMNKEIFVTGMQIKPAEKGEEKEETEIYDKLNIQMAAIAAKIQKEIEELGKSEAQQNINDKHEAEMANVNKNIEESLEVLNKDNPYKPDDLEILKKEYAAIVEASLTNKDLLEIRIEEIKQAVEEANDARKEVRDKLDSDVREIIENNSTLPPAIDLLTTEVNFDEIIGKILEAASRGDQSITFENLSIQEAYLCMIKGYEVKAIDDITFKISWTRANVFAESQK